MSKFSKLQKLDIRDLKGLILLFFAFIPAWILRKRNPKIWVIVERINDAQDNSWIFYNWVKKAHPEQPIYFILEEQAPSFDKKDKSMIPWGSLRHWLYYLASDVHIMTTFLRPMPNPRICYRLEKHIKKNVQCIYLRHGISKDGMEQHKYSLLKVRLFICGAKPEYDYIYNHSDYPKDNVKYTGFARFDELLEKKNDGHYILMMPTWRRYLGWSDDEKDNERQFLASEYYNRYVSLLKNEKLLTFAREHHYKIYFILHAEYRKFESLFPTVDGDVVCFVKKGESIHNYLMGASLLITDYSSVFFDVAYMGKPVIYYHFDYEEFRRKHLSESYFSYERDGMGPVIKDEDSLVETVKEMYDGHSFVLSEKYRERTSKFFVYRDHHNCERIFNEIKNIES